MGSSRIGVLGIFAPSPTDSTVFSEGGGHPRVLGQMGGAMHTLVLLAVLHGGVSIAPIRVFQPYPYVKCPKGYSLWWPGGKEFENDKYAQCVKGMESISARKATKTVKDVSLRSKERR